MNETHAPAAEQEWTFEAAMDRLEEIVARLDGEELELDDSLALFEEGVRLLRFAETVIDDADGRVRQLLDDTGGGFRMDDFPEPL